MKHSNRLRTASRIAIAASMLFVAQILAVAPAAAQSALNLAGVNPDGSVSVNFLKSATPRMPRMGIKGKNNGHNPAVNSGVAGIDSITNFVSQFSAPGFDPNGNPQSVWPFSMVGRAPQTGRQTTFRAPIIPVIVDLLDKNGNVAHSVDPTSFVQPVVQSPVFTPTQWFSGFGQFPDAGLRATFNSLISRGDDDKSDNGWHNVLDAQVKTTRHMRIPFGEYVFALNNDGTCCVFALVDLVTFENALFPATSPVDNSTVIGAAELAGDMKTTDIASLLFNNVYLFQGTPANCCILGFHSADQEPGDASNGNLTKLFVFNYSSWITNGLFTNLEDITALSHEMAETFNDPFGNNITPWWLSKDPVTGNSNCQDDLEVGDVVEVLSSNPVFAKQMPNGRTYHPQNIALLPWFAFQSPSTAQHQAYSFPDETTLTALSPANLQVNCAAGT